MQAITNPFMSPYKPKGLTDGSIPASFATFIQKNDLRLSFANAAGQIVSPETPRPTQVVPETMTERPPSEQ
jgi:hypothetical protein